MKFFDLQVLSCNACKMFFRRVEVDHITYNCKYWNTCYDGQEYVDGKDTLFNLLKEPVEGDRKKSGNVQTGLKRKFQFLNVKQILANKIQLFNFTSKFVGKLHF